MHCTLTPDDLATRGARWRALGPADAADLPNGLRLTFASSATGELHELAALERVCCSFASWDVVPDGDVTHLDVTAGEELQPDSAEPNQIADFFRRMK